MKTRQLSFRRFRTTAASNRGLPAGVRRTSSAHPLDPSRSRSSWLGSQLVLMTALALPLSAPVVCADEIMHWGYDPIGQLSITPTGTGFTTIAKGGAHGYALSQGVNALHLKKGKLRDSAKPQKDKLSAAGTFAFTENGFDPAMDFVQLSVGSNDMPLELLVPAGDPGWKSTVKGKHTWKTAKGVVPKWRLVLNTGKQTFAIKLSKCDFGSAVTNPIRTELYAGEYHGLFGGAWTTKKPGKFKYKAP
jgi:hypothetical protein